MLSERRAMRDYINVAALTDLVGPEQAVESLQHLNHLYKGSDNLSRLSAFSNALFETPVDFDKSVLGSYKGIKAPYNRWEHVEEVCCLIGQKWQN
jgi:hypothetical protein